MIEGFGEHGIKASLFEQSKFLTLFANTHLHKEGRKEEMIENLHIYTHIFTDREKRWLKIFVRM